ncbi:glycosyltransferase [Candidatus Saccharibacteria bacterium]|nr:glycosyltransferase [Candidatus Saccharibacteria bacterium]MBQ6130447.1 glycosyltransferase [Candidatus Saccharibacteria bacterium]
MNRKLQHIAYLSENQSSAQFRYRVQNPIAACQDSRHYQISSFTKQDLAELSRRLPGFDLLIIVRQTAKTQEIPTLIETAQSRGIKVVFDLDDLIFDCRDLPLLMSSTNSKNVLYWLGYIWGIRNIARRVDGFLTTNSFLAEKLKRSFDKPVAVIPNSLNQAQIKTSEKALKTQKPHVGFRLGYFSGSPTHAKDFRLIEPELLRFLETHQDAELKIVGYMDFSPRAKALLDAGRISFELPVDYLKLQTKIAAVDVNLAPLVENDFTNCKSELKFFEAAITETTTIASPTFAYKHAIQDGTTGFLARPGEWFDKLEYLYRHPRENQKIALAAKAYCLENYYGPKLQKEIIKAYAELSKI